jgi:hypothetical protein
MLRRDNVHWLFGGVSSSDLSAIRNPKFTELLGLGLVYRGFTSFRVRKSRHLGRNVGIDE